MVLAFAGATAQNNTVPGKTDIVQQEYLKTEEVPNSLYILPVHPEFMTFSFLLILDSLSETIRKLNVI